MNLKLKAKIYQYTGIFLAKKEMMDAVANDEYYSALDKIRHGLARGVWESDKGFISFSSKYRSKSVIPRLQKKYLKQYFYLTIDRVIVIYKTLRSDLGL